ncbi:hypothetical protein DMENIID0001_046060 [Sergentomyia squamirostris]
MAGKVILLLATMVVVAIAAPQNLISYSSSSNDNGYDFSYSTFDQSRDEHAVLVPRQGVAEPESDLSVQGSYSFTAEDGRLYTVTYVADVNGYRANLIISSGAPPPPAAGVPDTVGIDPNALKSLVG